jgi:UDP-glucose 4-epimerase
MPEVLLTGSSGEVGRVALGALESAGWTVRRFDITDGNDLLDEAAVLQASAGCDAIVHAGAISHNNGGTPSEIVATNVLGTWHVLLAADAARVSRVVYFSSVQVFGCDEGEGAPEYLPIDDAHPLRGARPYGMSKRLAEEMCATWTARTGIPTIVLRPVMILSEEQLRSVDGSRAEHGAYVHVDDVAEAVCKALIAKVKGHVRLTLCGPGAFDSSAARRTLGWRPAHRHWPHHSRIWWLGPIRPKAAQLRRAIRRVRE